MEFQREGEKSLQSLAEELGIPQSQDLKNYSWVKEGIHKIPYSFAKQRLVLPVEEREKEIIVAICDPLNIDSLQELRFLLKKEILPLFSARTLLEEAIDLCYHQKEGETKKLLFDLQEDSKESPLLSEREGYDLLEQKEQNPALRFLNAILIEAIQQGASDIHFEPQQLGLFIRYRLDGTLQNRHIPPKEYQEQMLTRIKVMSRLDIAERRLPQDGRIKLRFGEKEIDFRVSTMPVVYGERIVLRILDKSNILLGLDQIGMDDETLRAFRKMISFPEGIILVTGPTGSGKTTTLYSAVSELNSSEMNIMTIEDPVEYKLASIAQIGVNPKIGLDFATGLRHLLRQDPDAVMIGEIRDNETAQIAIHAALTGHLVLATLHTNDAPSAITRLADMGIELYLLSSSIIGILAQRLVRKICPSCRSSYLPQEGEAKELGLEVGKKLFRGMGCSQCFGSGYKGRHGIYELMTVATPLIRRRIAVNADSEELRGLALKQGMRDLRRCGAALVAQGITTSDEVFRVTRICEGS